jgi:hypothetical protein
MRREVTIGAVGGTLWAYGMRAWMVTLVGDESTFTLRGTLFGLVLPSAVVGGLLGASAALHKRGGGRPALIASPAILALAPLALPGAISRLATTGQGSGAIGMVSLAMVGAHGLTGQGRWRVPSAVVGLAPAAAIWLGPPMRPEIARTTQLGIVSAASFSLLYLVLVYACSLPMSKDRRGSGSKHPRPAVSGPESSRASSRVADV